MPAKNVALTITYFAWDTANNVGKTADGGNHTLKVVVDGTEGAVAGGITEVDSTNLKGAYKVTLTQANMDGDAIFFGGLSSTSGIAIIPIQIFTDGGVLPASAAPGASGGLPIVGSAPLSNLDAAVSSRSTFAGGNVASVVDQQAIPTSGTVQAGSTATSVTIHLTSGTAPTISGALVGRTCLFLSGSNPNGVLAAFAPSITASSAPSGSNVTLSFAAGSLSQAPVAGDLVEIF